MFLYCVCVCYQHKGVCKLAVPNQKRMRSNERTVSFFLFMYFLFIYFVCASLLVSVVRKYVLMCWIKLDGKYVLSFWSLMHHQDLSALHSYLWIFYMQDSSILPSDYLFQNLLVPDRRVLLNPQSMHQPSVPNHCSPCSGPVTPMMTSSASPRLPLPLCQRLWMSSPTLENAHDPLPWFIGQCSTVPVQRSYYTLLYPTFYIWFYSRQYIYSTFIVFHKFILYFCTFILLLFTFYLLL